MRLVILGAGGHLGTVLARDLAGLGSVVGLRRADLDVCDHAAVDRTIASLAPDVV